MKDVIVGITPRSKFMITLWKLGLVTTAVFWHCSGEIAMWARQGEDDEDVP